MTQFPDIEARLIAQEHTTAMLHASVEKLSKDITASFQHLAKYQGATEHELDIRFRRIDARLDRLEAHMATKEDLVTLENKFEQRFTSLENKFDKFEQRFTSLENKTEQRFASLEQRFASLDNKFDSVLQLLTVLTRKIAE
ncbi:MAG TPA: hypothetical protein VKY19_14855 [Ktedonosporobacter sp.]|nr:hypothetical protein [Ktedonosporobacter sp.]